MCRPGVDLLLLVLAPELVRGRGSEEDCERSQERGGGAAQQVTRKGEPRTSLLVLEKVPSEGS